MSDVDNSVSEYVGNFVDDVLESILDIVDMEDMNKHEYETFVTMLQDRVGNLPPFEEVYD